MDNSFVISFSSVPCSIGHYLSNEECLPCSVGTYQLLTGQTFCFVCPTGTTTGGTSSVSIYDCNRESSCVLIAYICRIIDKRGTKDNKGTVKLINLKQTDNAMAKNEKDKQTNNSTHDTT